MASVPVFILDSHGLKGESTCRRNTYEPRSAESGRESWSPPPAASGLQECCELPWRVLEFASEFFGLSDDFLSLETSSDEILDCIVPDVFQRRI